jgi:NAD(P)-dependent dehydrogenase (short-subunit alcohol dehydrogenase family)
MDLGLKGRSALVTGASKGIGLAIARQLAAEGCNVILVARTAGDLESARAAIVRESGASVETKPMDLSSGADVRALASQFPDIDILVNNAGAIPRGRIDEIDEACWRAAWDLKVFGYINMTREYFSRMKQRGSGVIINVIGTGGEKPSANYIVGAAGNASLMAFTRALGGASLAHGVRVVAINPGAVETDRLTTMLQKEATDQFGDPQRWRELLDSMPLGRPAKPEDIAAMAALLASDLSRSTSGTVITIDKGFANHP